MYDPWQQDLPARDESGKISKRRTTLCPTGPREDIGIHLVCVYMCRVFCAHTTTQKHIQPYENEPTLVHEFVPFYTLHNTVAVRQPARPSFQGAAGSMVRLGGIVLHTLSS